MIKSSFTGFRVSGLGFRNAKILSAYHGVFNKKPIKSGNSVLSEITN
mgnify:CR=1 FL=1